MVIDASAMRAWRSFLEAHSRITRLLDQELVDEQGISLSWYDALVQLSEAGGTLRMGEFADSLLLSRSATTRFVDRLEAAGLIERRVCKEDRRGMEVRLSETGDNRLREAAVDHLASVERYFVNRLSESDLDELSRIMAKVAGPEVQSSADAATS